MQYRINPKNNDKLSTLGYGCMRFSRKGTAIDLAKAEREIIYSIEKGVNYFDTGYIYTGSEVALGKILSKGYRDKVYLATKLPSMFLKNADEIETIFTEQKRRLQTDYIDYYLCHMLTGMKLWEKLKGFGIEKWIEEKKKSGEIHNIGFSFHGGLDDFKQVIDAYDWDFCYIQYNYMDEHSQAGVEGLRYATEKGIPVMIMEPLRGGSLAAKLPDEAMQSIRNAERQLTAAQWGLRWLFDQPEPLVVLSGMNSIEMIDENIAAACGSQIGCMAEEEHQLISDIRDAINKEKRIPCSGCSYCMPCPAGVDIPVCFRSYNIKHTEGWYKGIKNYFMCTALRKDFSGASNCVGCGKCERNCPQGIKIRDELKNVSKELESPIFKIARKASRLFVKL